MEVMDAGVHVLNTLMDAGYEAYFVGGMVRDKLLGLLLHDIDVTTSAPAADVLGLFERAIPTGLAHGTVTVLVGEVSVEVTTYRQDGTYTDGRRPDAVYYTASLVEDLRRRDFTINAMAMDKEGQIIDPLNGAADLQMKRIRAVGDARQRFQEDPLRMLRALRFCSKLGFCLEPGTRQALFLEGHLVGGLARERVMKELDGLMQGAHRVGAMELFIQTGLLGQFPDFKPLAGFLADQFLGFCFGIDLFLLAALFTGDLTAYLAAWPFSRSEKKLIKTVVGLWGQMEPLIWVQYKEGVDAAWAIHRLQVFFGQWEGPFVLQEPAINQRGELALDAKKIMAAAGLAGGPEAGRLLLAIEREVVLGKLKNDSPEILAYIGENYVSAQKNQ